MSRLIARILLQLGMCRCYQQLKQRDMAIAIIGSVVREDRQNLPAMLEFAKLTFDLGDLQAQEAAIIMLTCIVADKSARDLEL